MSGFKQYDEFDAVGLAELVRSGQVSPTELLEEAIARAEKVNPKVNAIIRPMYDGARERAKQVSDGPFAGVPFLLKDLRASYAGVPMMEGSRFLRDHVPTQDSEYVKRIKAAGLNVFGKTATPEFGVTPSTEPELTGPCRNPWDLSKSPGGSSGGASAAVASGIVPMASASDGGGSIRIPASCTGLFGLKPSRGRVPSGPEVPDNWYGFIAEHVVSRSVRDTAIALDCLAGDYPGQLLKLPSPQAPFKDAMSGTQRKLKIAFSLDAGLGTELHSECKEGVKKTVQLLQSLGHEVHEVKLPLDKEAFILAYSVLICAEIAATMEEGQKQRGKVAKRSEFEARTWGLGLLGRSYKAWQVTQAKWTLEQFSRQWMTFFEPYDALLTSTLGAPPCDVGHLAATTAEKFQLALLDYLPIEKLATQPAFVLKAGKRIYDYCSQTIPANVTGQPSMSVPLHWSTKGLPVGMMFTGRFGDEFTLLQLASDLEKAQPWFGKRAPNHVSLL